MTTRIATIFFILLLVFSFFPGCDAPRDNPNDPGTDRNIIYPDPDNPTTINSFRVRTKHIPEDTPFSQQDKILSIAEARLYDPDDITQVHLEVNDTLRFDMDYNSGGEFYSFSFDPQDYGYSVFDFIGGSFYTYIFDGKGYVTRSEKEMIVRVLEDSPEIVYPKKAAGSPGYTDSTSRTPTLEWMEYSSRFDITYSVVVRRFPSEVVFERSNIQRTSAQGDTTDSVPVSQPLSLGGEYYWTVSVIDDKGNETVSEHAFFIVRTTE